MVDSSKLEQLSTCSAVLTEKVQDFRSQAFRREGPLVVTSSGNVLEVGGGSHATSIVNDNGKILNELSSIISKGTVFVGSGRAYSNAPQIDLAEMLISLTGMSDARVFFTSGGSESFETALRIVFHAHEAFGNYNRWQVLGHAASYYGMTLAARNAGDHPVHSKMHDELAFNWPTLPIPTTDNIMRMRAMLKAHSKTVAAVVVEPISGTTGGAEPASPLYLQALREACNEIGAFLVVDETITAFGRVGRGMVSYHCSPDIVFGGKCLGASFVPISALFLSDDLCSKLIKTQRDLPLRLTFSGNSLSCTVAKIVQEYMVSEGIYQQVAENQSILENFLAEHLSCKDRRFWWSGEGYLRAIHCYVDKDEVKERLAKLRSLAERSGIEYLGGHIERGDRSSIHMMITPALDASVGQLQHIVSKATGLFKMAMS